MKFIDSMSWPMVIIICLMLGLAPFVPEPHVWEKLKMLAAGELSQVVDIFDLAMHGAPWVILLLKIVRYKHAK